MTTGEAIALGAVVATIAMKVIDAFIAARREREKTQESSTRDRIKSLEHAHADCRKHDDDSHRVIYSRLADIDRVVATIPGLTTGLQRVEGRLDSLGERVGVIGEAVARVEARLEGSPAE